MKSFRLMSLFLVCCLASACATATVGTPDLQPETTPASPIRTLKPVLTQLLIPATETGTETPTGAASGTPGLAPSEAPGTQAPTSQSPEAVVAAITTLSERLNIPESQLQVISSEQTQWPNSCLGLASPDEMCLEVITPGWLIVLSDGNRQYELHTDETGNRVRLRPGGLP